MYKRCARPLPVASGRNWPLWQGLHSGHQAYFESGNFLKSQRVRKLSILAVAGWRTLLAGMVVAISIALNMKPLRDIAVGQ
jgi:hypothetical protein